MTSPSVKTGNWWCVICPDHGTSDRHEADSDNHVRKNPTHCAMTSLHPFPKEDT